MSSAVLSVLYVLVVACSGSFIDKLSSELFQECTRWTPNEEKIQWMLTNKRANIECEMNRIHEQYLDLIGFISNFDDPNLFTNESVAGLSKIITNIKFSEEFLFKIPNIIDECCHFYHQHVDNVTAQEIITDNIQQFASIIFKEPCYNRTNAKLTVNFPFTELLVTTSTTILDIMYEHGNYRELPQWTVWKYLYAFIFENYIPIKLEDIYYLKDNINDECRYKQLLFIRELRDNFGVVFFHHKLIKIEIEVMHDHELQPYINEYNQVKEAINSLIIDSDHSESFQRTFDVNFLLFLACNTNFDFSTIDGDFRQSLIELIQNVIHILMESMHIDEKEALLHLRTLVRLLKHRNGLELLKGSSFIADILNNDVYDIRQCVQFLGVLLLVNSKFEINPLVLAVISHILNARFSNAWNYEHMTNTQRFVEELFVDLGSNRLFDGNTILELFHIHQSFTFGSYGQHEFFSAIIDILITIRIDWNFNETEV